MYALNVYGKEKERKKNDVEKRKREIGSKKVYQYAYVRVCLFVFL